MTEENKTPKPWQVTLPYDDVRAMEAQAELLNELLNDLMVLRSHASLERQPREILQEIIEKIRKAQQT